MAHDDFSRREFLKLSALFTAAGAMPLLAGCDSAMKAEPDAPLRIGYLPITDASPLLIAHHNGLFEKQGLEVERPHMFRSWAQLVEAFLSGKVNAVHMLSPMTVWARYGSRMPSKVVAWNHVNGSALTTAVRPDIQQLEDLGGSTFAIPFWYSIHNVVLQYLFKNQGVEPITRGEPSPQQVKLVVMAPSDMLPALSSGGVSGYIVAEPFCGAAELEGIGKVLRFTGDVWKDHACCVVQMHERDLDKRPDWTQKVVNGIVEAQAWMRDHREDVTEILQKDNPAGYTPHSYDVLAQTLLPPDQEQRQQYLDTGAIQNPEWDDHRIGFQPYPYPSYTEQLVAFMKETKVKGNSAFLESLDPASVANDLVDDRFVKKAIQRVGGMQAFGLPESFTRKEIIHA